MIRDVILGVFAAGWLIVVVVTVVRTGEVSGELWAVLGIGVGGILAAFRTDDRFSRPPRPPEQRRDPAEDATK